MGPWGSGTGQPRGKGLVFEKMSIARSCLGETVQRRRKAWHNVIDGP